MCTISTKKQRHYGKLTCTLIHTVLSLNFDAQILFALHNGKEPAEEPSPNDVFNVRSFGFFGWSIRATSLAFRKRPVYYSHIAYIFQQAKPVQSTIGHRHTIESIAKSTTSPAISIFLPATFPTV